MNPRIMAKQDRRKDEVSKCLQPITLLATTPPVADSHTQLIKCFYKIISSSESSFQVQGLRLQKRQVAQVRCVCMSVKVMLHVATNIPELPGKQRHPVTSKSIWRTLCNCTDSGYNSGPLKLCCPQSEKETSVV